MSEEEILKVIGNISEARIRTYEGLGFPEKGQEVVTAYFAIQEISSHFFVPLQVLEICLRNSIHSSLAPLFEQKWGDRKWYDLVQLSDESRSNLLAAKKTTASKCGKNFSEDDLISNIMFGFWVYMLDKPHRVYTNPYHFWQYVTDDVFPGRKGKSVKQMFDQLKSINRTRNRLYHHEPIWKTKKAGNKSFLEAISVLEKEYNKIYESLEWMAVEKKDFMVRLGFFQRFEECCQKHKAGFKN